MPECPDSAPDTKDRRCWERLVIPEDDGVDVISWLKVEMADGLDHEYAHAVLGPSMFGCDENGVPNFKVYRHEITGKWMVRAKHPVGVHLTIWV